MVLPFDDVVCAGTYMMLPASFHLRIDARMDGDTLLGGEPFALTRLRPQSAARIRAWRDGAPVGEGGALARALVMANLAQPVPPPLTAPVTAVIPVRDRSIARLLEALDVDEVIVVDDASRNGDALRAEAERAGARYVRRAARGGTGAARNDGLAAARHELVALIDSDCVPCPGWLAPLLAHFNDPDVEVVAPRIVALEAPEVARSGRGAPAWPGAEGASRGRGIARAIARYEARHSPLDRGGAPARVLPHGRVPFVPGAALLVRRRLRFDETLEAGEDVDLIRRARYTRYEPSARVAHSHRTDPRAWLARRIYYGATAAPLAQRHPGHAQPLHVSPWTTAAWAALAARRPRTALAIAATATALLARDVPVSTAVEIAGLGTLRSGRVVADALARTWWPASALIAVAAPRTRLPIAAATLVSARHPLKLADDLAYGLGLWSGCLTHRTIAPLRPAQPWRLARNRL